ncbi:MAG TPA: hypothetical protein EYO18_07790, partial [Candidatus Marinimicrobia bacterium]|nr:hypothetical protein [Candidatus Neomarinimicrobiota bacterium]
MKKIAFFTFIIGFMSSTGWAELDCPADSAYHIDYRTLLQNGSPNPNYGQEISTGLCGCLGFSPDHELNGNEITFTLSVVDNEPISGIQLDLYHDSGVLAYSSVSKGDKLENVADEDGNPGTMTLLGSWNDDHVRLLAYSTSLARTEGNGVAGNLLEITYSLIDGADLPGDVSFYFGLAIISGTSMDPEVLDVSCGYPDQENPTTIYLSPNNQVDYV